MWICVSSSNVLKGLKVQDGLQVCRSARSHHQSFALALACRGDADCSGGHNVTGRLHRFRANRLTLLLQGALAGVAHQSERASSGLRAPGDPGFLQVGPQRLQLKPRR